MTRIYKTGVVMDPELYVQLGNPSRANLILLGEDALIIPAIKGFLIKTLNNLPTLIVKTSMLSKVVKCGEFEAAVEIEQGYRAYRVRDCALDFHYNYTRFKGQ